MNDYSPCSSVTQIKQDLGWPSLEQRANARHCMLYKITHGMVAIQMPSYFKQPMAATCHSLWHPLVYCQIHTSANKYSFFPLAVVQWNTLQPSTSMLPTLTQFSLVVRSLDHHLPYHNRPVFNLILTSSF